MVGDDIKIGSIVIRCYNFDEMYQFWKQALHYEPKEQPKNGWVILRDPNGNGPNISLDKIDTIRTGKRNRVHFDLYAENQQTEVERLIELGARRYPWNYEENADYVVLEDPDENLFCVVQDE